MDKLREEELLSRFYKGEGDIKELVDEIKDRYEKEGSLKLLILLFNIYHASDLYESREKEVTEGFIPTDEELAHSYLSLLCERVQWAKLYMICLVNNYRLDMSKEECDALFDAYHYDPQEEGIYFLDMFDLTLTMLGVVSMFFRGSRDKERAERALNIYDSLEGE